MRIIATFDFPIFEARNPRRLGKIIKTTKNPASPAALFHFPDLAFSMLTTNHIKKKPPTTTIVVNHSIDSIYLLSSAR